MERTEQRGEVRWNGLDPHAAELKASRQLLSNVHGLHPFAQALSPTPASSLLRSAHNRSHLVFFTRWGWRQQVHCTAGRHPGQPCWRQGPSPPSPGPPLLRYDGHGGPATPPGSAGPLAGPLHFLNTAERRSLRSQPSSRTWGGVRCLCILFRVVLPAHQLWTSLPRAPAPPPHPPPCPPPLQCRNCSSAPTPVAGAGAPAAPTRSTRPCWWQAVARPGSPAGRPAGHRQRGTAAQHATASC